MVISFLSWLKDRIPSEDRGAIPFHERCALKNWKHGLLV
jgi:hypothetical protein